MDLEKISLDILVNNGERVALTFLAEAKQSLEVLGRRPNVGRRRGQLGKSLRSWPVPPYIALYRPTDDGEEIIRVIHGRWRLTRSLVEGRNT
jgi:plasmid stabilization system protein ParE